MRYTPGKLLLHLLGASAVLAAMGLVAGFPLHAAGVVVAIVMAALLLLTILDGWLSRRAWQGASPALTRNLPTALAIGVRKLIIARIELGGTRNWQCTFHDHTDASLTTDGLPASLRLAAGKCTEILYTVTPTRRGDVTLAPAALRVRSRLGLCELLVRCGPQQVIRVYPDFAQVTRYAWLAGDHRLQEIGIKAYRQRGEGTDFKQLAEYRQGDPIRHVDWKATLRHGKAIVREFQDERDQCISLLIDCGRRMRADDRDAKRGAAHFDQVLNAAMLLAYVALKQGDAVGVATFGTPVSERKLVAPRKGAHVLGALMSELYAVQPGTTHSDYVGAAQDFMRRQSKRALVILITNFRDEDSAELGQALRLLRSRHLVMVASLQERIVSDLIAQPLTSADAALEIASAHLYAQARHDAFVRLAAHNGLMIDAEPSRLGIELVNRYHAVKRAGMI